MVMYSHSRLSTFEQCPYRYKLRYIDKIKPEVEKSIEAHLGTCVHDTLEWLYIEVKKGKIPTIDDAITYYSEKWQNEFKPSFIIVKKEFTAKDYFEKGVKFLLGYYVKHTPFQDGTLELEKRIFIKLTEEHKLIGFIDRLSYNKEKNRYEVHDYKTANTLPTQAKMDEDRQLALYSIAIKELYGLEKEVALIWHYLAHDTIIESFRTNEELSQLKESTINLIKTIETAMEYPTKKCILCNWCEYKSMCPEFGGTIKTKEPKEKQVSLDNYPTLKKYIND
ncbi:PD-(D/E)XK nuclease family protein [archaeon]|jgi:putative RecB family exonuclease|nr:PD-(D/E)XK nuclease family protein [archaeon]